MLTISDLLVMDNEKLYEVYRYGVKHKNLKLINSVRSIVADRYSLKALKSSTIDSWRDNKEISRFFRC